MSCPNETIIADTNVGTDEEPRIRVMAECNGSTRTNCGFSAPFVDLDGEEHEPRDWWITSSDMKKYDELHQMHETSE